MSRKVEISEKYDPDTAVFWARFATEIGEQKKHCPTVALYENSAGEFFAVDESPKKHVLPTRVDLIDDPRAWLQERVKLLQAQM